MAVKEKIIEFDRSEIIFICSMLSNYSEEYLNKLSDKELIETYERLMQM